MTSAFDPEGREAAALAGVAELTGARVLEVGVGDGRLTWSYAARARSIVGIDPDPEAVSYLLEDRPPGLWDRIAGVVAEAERLPFARERFDAAVLAWSL
ncbi:MAG TPA: class I SAM-dependent methyltransferase [Anaerolineales bacterium]|nr:class I SAM-dependent methyltransferase [Anaerolineales bacterium]